MEAIIQFLSGYIAAIVDKWNEMEPIAKTILVLMGLAFICFVLWLWYQLVESRRQSDEYVQGLNKLNNE